MDEFAVFGVAYRVVESLVVVEDFTAAAEEGAEAGGFFNKTSGEFQREIDEAGDG